MQTSVHVGLQFQHDSVGKGGTKLQPLEKFCLLPSCLVSRRILTLRRQKCRACYRNLPGGYWLEAATPCGWHTAQKLNCRS